MCKHVNIVVNMQTCFGDAVEGDFLVRYLQQWMDFTEMSFQNNIAYRAINEVSLLVWEYWVGVGWLTPPAPLLCRAF